MELTLFNVCMGIIIFFVGMLIFSYLNRVIRILPEGIEDDEQENLTKDELKVLKEKQKERRKDKARRLLKIGNVCPHCVRDTVIDIMGGILAILPVLYYGFSLSWVTVFLVYCVLVVIAVIDMDTQYIPPELNLMLAGLGLLSILTLPGPTLIERFIGVICVSLPLLLITFIVPGAFGGGDIKMMAAVGLLLGWKGTVIAFLIGLFLGGGYGMFVLATKKLGRKEHFAFGPFLAIGIAISLYGGLGARLMDMYIGYIVASFQPY